jgi:hypothetical protein
MARSGGWFTTLLFVLITAPAQAGMLVLSLAGNGEVLARFPVPEGAQWSILWNHSVQGFEVQDIYENRGGAMMLVRSHLPDFAAGLDHIPGRGRQVSDGQGGYWIEDIDEPVPGNAYILRPGPDFVNHRLRTDSQEISLTALAERARLQIALIAENQ